MEELSRLSFPPADGPGGQWSVVLAQRPLVQSICRKYLKGADVEDAVQETFVRYFRVGVGQPIESLPAWLTRVARTVCLDLLRRKGAERRRTKGVGVVTPADTGELDVLTWRRHDAITQLLPRAVRQLSATEQHLLAERFITELPLRVLASQRQQSIATLSRRATALLSKLAGVLRDLGVIGSDETLLGEYFADRGYAASRDAAERDVLLRLTRDRRRLEARLRVAFGPDGFDVKLPPAVQGPLWPGWTRPIRVGVMVHYHTIITPGYRGTLAPGENQVMSSTLLADPRFDLIAIAEPRTSGFGAVERTIRDFRLIDGLIDADDAAGLASLDAIVFGLNFVVTPVVLQAIHTAVSQHGVGYYKDGWLGANHDGTLGDTLPDFTRDLMLSASPVFNFHMPGRCGRPVEAVVCAEWPLLNLPVGTVRRVSGCAPAFVPAPSARVIMRQRRLVRPEEHGFPGVGPLPMPSYLTGQIGRGRAVVVTSHNHAVSRPDWFDPDYFPRLIAWLAEPRREAERGPD